MQHYRSILALDGVVTNFVKEQLLDRVHVLGPVESHRGDTKVSTQGHRHSGAEERGQQG